MKRIALTNATRTNERDSKMATTNTTTTRVHKSELSTLRAGDTFSTRFGIVQLNESNDGKRQCFNVTVIEAREGRSENGEQLFVRYTKLNRVEETYTLEESDLIDENEEQELSVPQFMWVEACKQREEITVASKWSFTDRIAIAMSAASIACLHVLIASLFV